MQKQESIFWALLKPHLPGHVTRIESWLGSGVPDIHGVYAGIEYWLELKAIKSGFALDIRPAQVAWHLNRHWNGGKSYFVIRKLDRIFIYDGCYAKELCDIGLRFDNRRALFNKPYDWDTFLSIILGYLPRPEGT